MTDTATAELRKTPLDARHRALHARMVPFAGWEMPVEYSGIAREHMAVRTAAAIFDVSHMGEIEIAGKDAVAAVQRVACNDASRLRVWASGVLLTQGPQLLQTPLIGKHPPQADFAPNTKRTQHESLLPPPEAEQQKTTSQRVETLFGFRPRHGAHGA